MKPKLIIGGTLFAVLVALAAGSVSLQKRAAVQAAGVQAPIFEVDPMWPRPLPNHWLLGQTIGVSVDAEDHIWIIHRPNTLDPGERHATTTPPIAHCCASAPPVLEFDEDGNILRHWGGPGPGYDWPASNHGITIDYKGNVWIGANGRFQPTNNIPPGADGQDGATGKGIKAGAANASADSGEGEGHAEGDVKVLRARGEDNMLLKFTQDGKFLLQIGKPNHSKGSNDTENVRLVAKTLVDKQTNELYAADGYGNRRVIVFDADTGKYKRHWGAYGHKPDDTDLGKYNPDAPVAQQFRNPVHCVALAVDRLLYVCDRVNDRIQVFKTDGTFVKESFVEKRTLGSGSTWEIAFSKDSEQKYIYLTDGENDKIHVLLRDTLQVLTSFGDGGRQPGEFYGVHSIDTDSKGNIFTGETFGGRRVQKFIYKGLGPVTKEDQGVVWPKANSK